MTGRAWRAGLLLAGLISALAGVATAQEQRFDEETNVTLVEIPVQVLANGAPVRGLTRESFVVRADGKAQEIVSFEVIDLKVETPSPSEQPRLAARRQFLLLFDLSFSDPSSVERARTAATALVGSGLHPTDLVGVAMYRAARGAEMILGFTTDRSQLARALEMLAPAQPLLASRDPLALVLTNPLAGGSVLDGATSFSGQKEERAAEQQQMARDLMTMEARKVRNQREAEVLSLTGALEDLAQLMADLPGRKQVVLFSEGFDGSLVTGSRDLQRMQQMATDSASGQFFRVDSEERFGSSTVQSALSRTLDAFRRADCAIQAVDIGGIRAGAEARPQVGGEDGLFLMARDTGGEFYRNYNDLGGAVGELMERTSVTYLLAIQPPDLVNDGRYHPLKVQLADGARGRRLLHRPGFYAPRPYGELSAAERRVNTAGLIMAGSEGGRFPTAVLTMPFPGPEAAYVPVILELDGPSLLADATGDVLPLEVYAYAIDSNGEVRDFFAQSMAFELDRVSSVLRRTGVKFWGGFDLPAGDYALRILVRNRQSGSSTLRVVPLAVPIDWSSRPCLLPPLIPESRGDWVLTQETGGQTEIPFPFRLDGQPFMPAARPILRREEQTALSLVACGLGAAAPAASATLVTSAGDVVSPVALALRSHEPQNAAGVSRWTAEIASPSVEPGSYELVVHLRTEAGAALLSRIPVDVEG